MARPPINLEIQAVVARGIQSRLDVLRISQSDLARAIGVQRSAVNSWLATSGDHRGLPSVESLIKMAAVLETSVDYLLGVTDDPARGRAFAVTKTPNDRIISAMQELLALRHEIRSPTDKHDADGAAGSGSR